MRPALFASGASRRGCAPVPNRIWGRGLSERSEESAFPAVIPDLIGDPASLAFVPAASHAAVFSSVAGFVRRNVDVAQLSQEPQHQSS